MNCRKCGKELTGSVAIIAEHGGDKLCGMFSCREEEEKAQPMNTMIQQNTTIISLLESINDRLK